MTADIYRRVIMPTLLTTLAIVGTLFTTYAIETANDVLPVTLLNLIDLIP